MTAALSTILDGAGLESVEVVGAAADAVTVADVVLHTDRVGPGSLFCCVRGSRVDGHDLAAGAVAAGAVAVLAERRLDLPGTVAQILVPSVREAMGPVAASFHGHPSRRLTVVGVTGTNGKTTTTLLLRSVFQASGREAAVIGTLNPGAGAPPTTPDAPDLQARLAELAAGGTEVVAMEVSSHGLAMRRVDGTRFAMAVFTNLSQDHLDVHDTMEAYFAAKARLFTPALSERAVVNLDDTHGRLLLDSAQIPTTGWSAADASDVRLDPEGSSFGWRGTELRVPLPGRHNVSNALGAATAAVELGVPLDAVARGLAATPPVRGRFEPVVTAPFTVVVDYAHTPDGLEHALGSARELVGAGGRVIVVFGAGGDRDPAKRPGMGEVAGRLADVAVVTSDNPRSEDPMAIIDAVRSGMDAATAAVLVEPDRRRAIAAALEQARPGDLVVLAGKGHETTQTIGDTVIEFDDAAVARELLGIPGPGAPMQKDER